MRKINKRRYERAQQEYQAKWMESIHIRVRESESKRLRENF